MLRLRGTEWYRVTSRQTEDGSHLIVFSDMSEFVDRGLKLKESEARFERLAEHLPGAILRRQELANGSFVFDYWNSGVRDLTGLEPDGFTGPLEPLLAQVHPDDQEAVRNRFALGDRSQASWGMEFRIRHVRGTHTWVSLTMRARLNRIGRAVFEGILLDISERKQVEQTIRQAKEEAEKGSQAKTNFLANMSHELRTPLNAVIGFSEMMINQTMGPLNPPKYREYAGDIRGAAVHLLDLISDILDLSRHEAGQFELRESTLDVNELLQECERYFSDRASQRQIAFQVTLSQQPVRLRVDHLRIRQIMLNLISNALKFTDAGGAIQIDVRLDENGPQLRVRDTGIGMDKAQIAKAFEPFGRVESQLTAGREGTGLGLPLSAVLAERHDGELRLESEPGQGTLAILQLPRHRLLTDRLLDHRRCA
jgi:PAS domain S-box-containing protein